MQARLPNLPTAIREALQHQSFEAGRLLIDLSKEPDYGEWKTFDNLVQLEFRILPRYAYRLMFAYRIREFLKEHGRVLPIAEGQVRPLRQLRTDKQRKGKLTLEELQLKAWDIAVAMKQ